MTHRRPEQGSALVYIFIGVALFGALMFLFSRGASQNTSGITKQQANIAATELLSYSKSLESTVQRLISNGCSENEITFQNDIDISYSSPYVRPDKSCNVFDTAGGRARYIAPPSAADTKYEASGSGYKNYGFNGRMAIEDLGTTAPELIIWTMTNKEVCDAVNAGLGKTTADDTFGAGLIVVPYVGDFADASAAGVIGDDAYKAGTTGCLSRPIYTGQYIFYSVLITR